MRMLHWRGKVSGKTLATRERRKQMNCLMTSSKGRQLKRWDVSTRRIANAQRLDGDERDVVEAASPKGGRVGCAQMKWLWTKRTKLFLDHPQDL